MSECYDPCECPQINGFCKKCCYVFFDRQICFPGKWAFVDVRNGHYMNFKNKEKAHEYLNYYRGLND